MKMNVLKFNLWVMLLGPLSMIGGNVQAEEDPGWAVNPLTSKFFSAEYFPSSRFGQIFVPQAAAQLGNTTVMRLNQCLLGPNLAAKFNGLSGEYLAHFGWRLGCDQGYLMAAELQNNQYASTHDYFWGRGDPQEPSLWRQRLTYQHYSAHPALVDHYDARITVAALLTFAAGQVIGQRYFGPQVKKMLGKVKIKNKFFDPNRRMGFWSSQIFYDDFGWPNGRIQTRADALSKIAGIFLGSYLGWALNDVGWQMAHWQRFSLDPFQAYLPEFSVGEKKWGSIDGGWGILGFTIGGFTGHNLGAALADYSFQRYGRPGGWFLQESPMRWAEYTENVLIKEQFKRTSYQLTRPALGLKWTSAIAGNFILGVTLTTYCPHLYRKLHHLYTAPATISLPPAEINLNPAELQTKIRQEITIRLATYAATQLDAAQVQQLLNARLAQLNPAQEALLGQDLAEEKETADGEEPSAKEDAPLPLDHMSLAQAIMQEYGDHLTLIAQQMGNTLTYLVGRWAYDLADMQDLAQVRSYFKTQLLDFLPPAFLGYHHLPPGLLENKLAQVHQAKSTGTPSPATVDRLLAPVTEAHYVDYLKAQAAAVIRPLADLLKRRISGLKYFKAKTLLQEWEEQSSAVHDLAALEALMAIWPRVDQIEEADAQRFYPAWRAVEAKINSAAMLNFFKGRFIQAMIDLYPLIYRWDFEQKLQAWWQTLDDQDDEMAIALKTKEQILISELHFLGKLALNAQNSARRQAVLAQLQKAKQTLLADNLAYYQNHPDLLADYRQQLDDLLQQTEQIKNDGLQDLGLTPLEGLAP